MSRTRPAKKVKLESEISSTPVCDDFVVSRWIELPGEALASIIELAQQEHDEDNAEFVTSFTIDHYQLPQLIKALKLNPELGAGVNGLALVIDCPNAELGPRTSPNSIPRMVKKALTELTILSSLTLDIAGPDWSTRPLSHLLGATPAAPLALPGTLTRLHVAHVHVWLDELEHVFRSCAGIQDLEVVNLRGNCVAPLSEPAVEGRVQLVRLVVHQSTLAAAQLVWLLQHCSPTGLDTLILPLPGFDLPNALSELMIDISLPLSNLQLINRFPPPKPAPAAPVAAAAAATDPAADDSEGPPARHDPSRFVRDILSRATGLDTFRLELCMCPPTNPAADGVAQLLGHLPRTVSTLVLDESAGSAALRAGVLAHLEATEEEDDEDGGGLSRVVTVSVLKKSEGPASKCGKQFRGRLGEFGVKWIVAGEDGEEGDD